MWVVKYPHYRKNCSSESVKTIAICCLTHITVLNLEQTRPVHGSEANGCEMVSNYARKLLVMRNFAYYPSNFFSRRISEFGPRNSRQARFTHPRCNDTIIGQVLVRVTLCETSSAYPRVLIAIKKMLVNRNNFLPYDVW